MVVQAIGGAHRPGVRSARQVLSEQAFNQASLQCIAQAVQLLRTKPSGVSDMASAAHAVNAVSVSMVLPVQREQARVLEHSA